MEFWRNGKIEIIPTFLLLMKPNTRKYKIIPNVVGSLCSRQKGVSLSGRLLTSTDKK